MNKPWVDLDGEVTVAVSDVQIDGAVVARAGDKHCVVRDAAVTADCRGKKPDGLRAKAGTNVPLIVLGPAVIDLSGLVAEKVGNHWHLLAIRLEPNRVAACFGEAVNEDCSRDMDIAQACLIPERSRLCNLVSVELVKEGVLVSKVDPELMRCLAKQEV